VRKGCNAGLAQPLELRPPLSEKLRLRLFGLAHEASLTRAQAASILVIFSLRFGPRGTATSTISPFLWSSNAWPIGDS
jgi:hypothetical protein